MVLRTWKGQPTLEQVIRPPTPVSSKEEEVERIPGLEQEASPAIRDPRLTLVSFEAFLKNTDGNQKVQKLPGRSQLMSQNF